ncbi:hypothetical protein PV08_07385 [Exophiala spinifera]|uniref:N-acetylgalactosaminide beta-1,3-galactosyltransferase n=1 Tax=Exophiala spinifera TaxID=91928 RepID=A0A0D1YI43_9EURO|nr:uncharacterized protein PV08_07385 [Exophiala spinifera]KIW14601.1 hypothetical protein PV08_07385 [Exophiala spinifera]
MALTLPRGLSLVKLTVIFAVILCLVFFKSLFLPSSGVSPYNLAPAAESWWHGFKGDSSAAVSDVDTELDYSQLQDVDLTSEITDFEDPVPAPSSASSAGEAKGTAPRPTAPGRMYKPFDPSVPACRQLPGADRVVVIVKTGATEVFARLPQQLITLAACVPNLMIFSDMEQDVGQFHLYDALDEIGPEYRDHHEDFDFYHDIHRAHAMHGDVSLLGSQKGWNLDKWKNIPMLHKAYTQYPKADWFVTIDADTYLGWTNLLLLLNRLNPEDPLYAGCVYWHGPTQFAQGGTGYLLSRNAVEKFEAIRTPERIADWERETSTICCGDVMLGVAMGQAGVDVRGSWPMFQVEPPCSLSWTPPYWCSPAITWHHVHTYDIQALWEFEKTWINRTWTDENPGSVPYLYKDAFEYFVQPNIADKKLDWNNYSGDKIFTKPAEDHVKEEHDWDHKSDEEKQQMWDELNELQKHSVESFDACRAACLDDGDCKQFSWHPGTCKLNESIKVGHAVETSEEYASGWVLERVQAFKESQGTCEEPRFSID